MLLAVDDPRHNIGSGSATLNALLCVTEYLAAQNNEKVSMHFCGYVGVGCGVDNVK